MDLAYEANPDVKIKFGICGEHGVDKKSIQLYLHKYGLDYVSGSPRRLPIASFAASQEALKGRSTLERAPPKRYKIHTKEYPLLPNLASASDTDEILSQINQILDQSGETTQSRAAIFSNLNLSKINTPEFRRDPVFDTLVRWASFPRSIQTKVILDKPASWQQPVSVDQIGLLRAEDFVLGNPAVRKKAQEYLLTEDKETKTADLDDITDKVSVHMRKFIGPVISADQRINILLPDFPLAKIFDDWRSFSVRPISKGYSLPFNLTSMRLGLTVSQFKLSPSVSCR